LRGHPRGYAFGRFQFPGKNVLFLLTLAILMVPYATILIALYVLLGWLGLQGSLIGLSLVRPGLVTVALFAFLTSWGEFFAPLILLNSTDKFTMILAVVNMRTASFGAIDYPALEAGVTFMAIPCLLLFLILQRSYVRGFMSGALRG
jgi:multiple sugar transport system permease protein